MRPAFRLHPAVLAAGLCGAAALLGPLALDGKGSGSGDEHEAAPLMRAMPCPPRTIPDGQSCVPLPEGLGVDAPSLARARGARSQPDFDHLPLRPDRPESFDRYRLPVEIEGPPDVLSGYDLWMDPARRRHLDHAIGHGAIDLGAPRGKPIHAVDLTGQEAPAEVVYAGPFYGTTVITRHAVREAGQLRNYLLLYGHLERPAPASKPGAAVEDGEVVGFVGDTGSPGNVHLHLEVRRLRPGASIEGLAPRDMVEQVVSIPCDPRNVLPLR